MTTPATSDETLRFGTALGDDSVLVVAGPTLRRIGRDGALLLAVTLEADIVAPPVVDADGRIYVATATALTQLR